MNSSEKKTDLRVKLGVEWRADRVTGKREVEHRIEVGRNAKES